MLGTANWWEIQKQGEFVEEQIQQPGDKDIAESGNPQCK